ncbi:glycoside hydrolase family 16 protein [Paxillus rubicundulus Ve08.2h10]|uniref:Glycoside hydrolase family 16 protein n=1 Tax=Paxillus rubicundulus Ve08.2h10 TaxID=930991 RepID=A0A0D0E8T2_9AGAM|nr:glycoside hydrolase family 16 protein [Paxillus rubicundulus Ve08.2h10]
MSRNHRRPISGQSQNASSEDDSLVGHGTGYTSSPLSPPRPFFLASSRPSDDYPSTASSAENGSDSDRESPPSPPSQTHSPRNSVATSSGRKSQRNHRRRSQLAASQFSAESEGGLQPEATWDPSSLYESGNQRRPPPSAYTFPFQAYKGNPDPIPGVISRRSSVDSIRMVSRSTAIPTRMPRINKLGDGPPGAEGLPMPNPPFLSGSPAASPYRSSAGSVSHSTLYRSSAAAGMADAGSASLPRASSATAITFRSPFLSPASRPSSMWSPPTYSNSLPFNSPSNTNSMTALPLPPIQKKAMVSTRLHAKLKDEDKPWLALKRTKVERASKCITFGGLLLGIVVAAVIVFRGYTSVHILKDSQLCLVVDDEFSGGSLDTSTWTFDVELGGFGNGEFEMTTNSPNNVYISNGQLFIMPTLTSDSISGGYSSVMDGGTYTLDGCTATSGVTEQGAFVLPNQKRQDTGNGTTTGNGNTGGPSTNTTSAGGGNGGGTATNGTLTDGGTTGNSTTTLGGGSTNSTTTSSNSTTTTNSTSSGGSNGCTAVSSAQAGTVINPVMSGRINTRGKKSIKYGKIEVRAKLPQGDWLWPAIWLLPEGNDSSPTTGVYGGWPVSGEIDLLEARGNLPSYPAQGSNYVRSTLNYGPFAAGSTPISTGVDSITTTLVKSLYGWVSTKRGNFASDYHVYAMEWTGTWMRFYTDSRLQAMINLDISSKNTDSYFFNVGDFPAVAMNMSSGEYIEVQDPWSTAYGGTAAAPFDQQFYLVIDLAVGGTSGWFPDGVGGKPWYDSSATAMRDFASAQTTWSATWPSSPDSRAFKIDYVKMWQLC